jgi:transcription elongation factor GreA
MDKITMSAEELEAVQRELRHLESVGRSAIAARIKTAREWGDLKENGEYHAAKEDQAHLETRILRLREQVRSADVIEVPTATDVVQHGSTVGYTDVATKREQKFTLVAPYDAKPAEGTLSITSPVAKALLGHRVGDKVEVQTPNGVRALTIDSIG